MTEGEADHALAELLAEIDDFITCLSADIGFESRLIAAQHPGLHALDARGRPLLMPRVMLLAALCEHPGARTLPSRVLAADWQQRYLAIDAMTPNGTGARLRQPDGSVLRLIEITFEALAGRLPVAADG